MDRLVLWDVDGTLLAAGEIGAAVFDRAIEAALGVRADLRVRMSGKTDPQIVTETLDLLGVDHGPEQIELVLEHLHQQLAAAEEVLRRAGRVLPGVEALLARLHGEPRVHPTLLTGNIAPNALVKVGAFGLDRWLRLDIGAYGSDHADRRELVPVALERAARAGLAVDRSATWIVGDAANDLACARAGGVRCLLVGTGRTPVEELAALEPDAVLPDMSEVEAVAAILCR